MRKRLAFLLVLVFLVAAPEPAVLAQAPRTQPPDSKTQSATEHPAAAARSTLKVCAVCVRAFMEFLASDALRGRGSGTHDELVAATYIASELRQYGIEPAADEGGYIQRVPTLRRSLSAPPQMKFTTPGDGASAQEITWTHGKEMLVRYLSQPEFSGPLQKIDPDSGEAKVQPGAIVFLIPKFLPVKDRSKLQSTILHVISAGATAVLIPASPERREHWEEDAKKLPELPFQLEGTTESELGGNFNVVVVNEQAEVVLKALADGTLLRFEGHAAAPEKGFTWNAVGVLRGRDPRKTVILLSAHLDHLGIGEPVNGDNIYNGADDDASGTTAVLELARILGAGARPRRTVIFALFGSEETGGLGSTYFREHPPLPLREIAVNLEFEMLGRADPAVRSDTVWLTGWERSNLGPTLAARGAKLVGDPHPEQNFFARSDNYVLAKKGVVAQTVSSYGLHRDYHQPSDDLAHIDFKHMDAAIGSLLRPVSWLVNSSFTPTWTEGGKP